MWENSPCLGPLFLVHRDLIWTNGPYFSRVVLSCWHLTQVGDTTQASLRCFWLLTLFFRVTGGELFDKIVERVSYTEEDASALAKQIIGVILYIHNKDIVHCDLKVCKRSVYEDGLFVESRT